MHSNKKIKYLNRIDKKILIEKTPGLNQMIFLYKHNFGKILLDNVISKITCQKLIGFFMDNPLSKILIRNFVKCHAINLKESLKKLNEFDSFNDFFTRKLKTEARTVNQKSDALVSPADGKILVFNHLEDSATFYIKGKKLNLKKLLNNNSFLCNEFKDGALAIIRLAPADYHRFHFPIEGLAQTTLSLPGKYYSVSPIALKTKKEIFEQNHRNLCILTNDSLDKMLIIEVGATFVGTIKQTYLKNTQVFKGQEKGYFKFGGSTVILIFKKNTIVFDQDLLINTNNKFETSIKMGEQIALINQNLHKIID